MSGVAGQHPYPILHVVYFASHVPSLGSGHMGVSENGGTLLGVPLKIYGILVYMRGTPIVGNPICRHTIIIFDWVPAGRQSFPKLLHLCQCASVHQRIYSASLQQVLKHRIS